MNPVALILGIPVIAGLLFFVLPFTKVVAKLNVVATFLTFIASLILLLVRPAPTPYFLIDDLNTGLVILTSFIIFTTSIFSAQKTSLEKGVAPVFEKRLYHPMFQAFLFMILLALVSNNLGVMWFAAEGSTLTTVVLIGLMRTQGALAASWKYFILCGVGIALALFGTTLFYLAAQPSVGSGMGSLTWSILMTHAKQFNPALLNIAFVFLLIGYGTKAGLAPMHAWMPDTYAEGPAILPLFSGLLLNMALYALLRFKMLMTGNGHALVAGPLLVTLGLVSLVLAGFMMYRRTDLKRLFAYSSMEHIGLMAFAFGVGGPLANFAGLLHMILHSLTKSGLFYVVGNIFKARGTFVLAELRGLTASHPRLGWALVLGVVALVGMPPFGLFMSEFLLVTSTVVNHPWLAVPLIGGLLIAFGALLMKVQTVAFGAGEAGKDVSVWTMLPFYAHMVLVLAASFFLPEQMVAWFQNVAKLLG